MRAKSAAALRTELQTLIQNVNASKLRANQTNEAALNGLAVDLRNAIINFDKNSTTERVETDLS